MNSTDKAKAKAAPGRVAINRKQLLVKVPLCARTIFDMEKRGEFPQRFQLSRRLVAWDLAEIDEWLEQHKRAARGAATPNPLYGEGVG